MDTNWLRQYRGFIVLSLFAVVILAMLAWNRVGTGFWHGVYTRRWSEEALLPSGKKIVVRRTVRVQESSAFGGGAYNAVEVESTLRFTGEFARLAEWSAPLLAQAIYVDEAVEEWVIVANTTSCEVMAERAHPRFWFAAGRPPTSYFEFRLKGEEWVQVPLSQASLGRVTNLLLDYKKAGVRRVSAASKQKWLRESRYAKEYLAVLERPDANCTDTTETQVIWNVEDEILNRLDAMNATLEERDRVGQLVVSTRLQYIGRESPEAFEQDSDAGTVQILINSRLNNGEPGVSPDGQMIYSVLSPVVDDAALLRLSYSRRLAAAGLQRFSQ